MRPTWRRAASISRPPASAEQASLDHGPNAKGPARRVPTCREVQGPRALAVAYMAAATSRVRPLGPSSRLNQLAGHEVACGKRCNRKSTTSKENCNQRLNTVGNSARICCRLRQSSGAHRGCPWVPCRSLLSYLPACGRPGYDPSRRYPLRAENIERTSAKGDRGLSGR